MLPQSLMEPWQKPGSQPEWKEVHSVRSLPSAQGLNSFAGLASVIDQTCARFYAPQTVLSRWSKPLRADHAHGNESTVPVTGIDIEAATDGYYSEVAGPLPSDDRLRPVPPTGSVPAAASPPASKPVHGGAT